MTFSNLAFVFSLALAPAYLFAEGAGAERTPAPIAIYMSFDGEHSSTALDAMKQ